ncbi:MAG TPA: hypothetical protein VMF91_04215 [Bryobacteraceae bacterium]|nr:hypothetical protein [Bryobacteraceae bacterium]
MISGADLDALLMTEPLGTLVYIFVPLNVVSIKLFLISGTFRMGGPQNGLRGRLDSKSALGPKNPLAILLGRAAFVLVRIRFQSGPVVYGLSKILFATEVALRRLHGHMAQEKLYLLDLTAGQMTKSGAATP